jgi:acetyl-CoA carboxylase beta subunit
MPYGETYTGDWPYMEPNAQEAAREREDAITDEAIEALRVRDLYAECPGCELLVHHSDVTAHVRSCQPLRAWAGERV